VVPLECLSPWWRLPAQPWNGQMSACSTVDEAMTGTWQLSNTTKRNDLDTSVTGYHHSTVDEVKPASSGMPNFTLPFY